MRRIFPTFLVVAILVAPGVRAQHMDRAITTFGQFELLEYQPAGSAFKWDGEAFVGTQRTKLWLKTEGFVESGEGDIDVLLLGGRTITAFWDVEAGIRVDFPQGEDAGDPVAHLALALEGLAPYWFEVESAVYLSHKGHVSAGLSATYESYLTQRLILEPRLEFAASAHDVTKRSIAPGVNEVGVGARVRYEIKREFAPYLGVTWTLAGEDEGSVRLVLGARLWR